MTPYGPVWHGCAGKGYSRTAGETWPPPSATTPTASPRPFRPLTTAAGRDRQAPGTGSQSAPTGNRYWSATSVSTRRADRGVSTTAFGTAVPAFS